MNTKLLCSFVTLLTLSGCSTISQKDVFLSMESLTADRGVKNLKWIKNEDESKEIEDSVQALLSKPLTQEDAVRVCLLNNRSLQQTYERIGIAQSELVQAGLLSNPLVGYSVGRGNGITTSTLSVEFAFLDLLWIPLRRELGGLALEEAKLSVGDEVLKMVRDTKINYIDARVAEEKAALYDEVLKSYEASVQLAVRQMSVGNLSKRNFLKIQDAYAHARLESMRFHRDLAMARESLNKMMGVYAQQTHYTLSDEPLTLPSKMKENTHLEDLAMRNRLDISAAQKAVEYSASEVGYTGKTRLIDEVQISGQSEKKTNENRFNTFGIKIPLPLFDMGQGRVSRAQSNYNASVHHLYELAVNTRSEVREAYAKTRYAYDMAHEYQDSILDVNRDILKETQLFYNGMLEGIYELLEDQRRYTETKMEALSAMGEYQKERSNLIYTIGGENNATR
ncbi:MAG: TolC family protein [Sulfuricurvum sp.]|jgi:outer membrane protein TolC